MDAVRKGQIALAYLKHVFRREGVRITPNLRDEVVETAKVVGIDPAEAMEFVEEVVREMVEEAFAPKQARKKRG